MINRDKFKSIADSFKDKKVLIVGDVMLFQYFVYRIYAAPILKNQRLLQIMPLVAYANNLV